MSDNNFTVHLATGESVKLESNRELGARQIQWCRAKLVILTGDGLRHIFTEMEGTRADDDRYRIAVLLDAENRKSLENVVWKQ